jgi:hypothetical protein
LRQRCSYVKAGLGSRVWKTTRTRRRFEATERLAGRAERRFEAIDRADLGVQLGRRDSGATGQLEQPGSDLGCPLFELPVERGDSSVERADR